MMINKIKILVLTVVIAGSVGVSNSAQATLNISDSPMFVAVSIDPNIKFLLDDSGSMRFGFMPGELDRVFASGSSLVDDLIRNCSDEEWEGRDYEMCAIGADGRELAFLVSSYLNKIYFDPDTRYVPPIKPNGDRYPDMKFDDARLNGYGAGDCSDFRVRCVDLNSNYRAVMDDYYYGNQSNEGFAVSPYGRAGAAFYYRYNPRLNGCDHAFDNDCYEYVNVSTQSKEVQQNFANWFSYYRTRMMVAKVGVSQAFHEQSTRMRVGYGLINSQNDYSGVRSFSDEHRVAFFDWLDDQDGTVNGSTPLRTALEEAGEYFETAEPWREDPEDNTSRLLSCRQSYSILMTDGYWSGGDPSVADEDGDGESKTLADVAYKYYDTDLRDDIDNNVPTSEEDQNQRQHMVTFGVGLGVTGTIQDTEAAFAWPPEDDRWPDPDDGDPEKIDDLLHAAVNSKGGFFSAADPVEFARELSAILSEVVARANATTSVAVSATRLTTESLVYAAAFDSADWSGELFALNAEDGSVESLATEQLESQGANGRKIFSYDPVEEEGLVFDTTAADALRSRLTWSAPEGEAWTAENIINYIRGNDTPDGDHPEAFRERSVMLGDIVNSRPFFSGSGNEGWGRLDQDYLDYIDGHKNDPDRCDEVEGACDYAREDTLFIGANDGMLHAFDAETLEELFAYVPSTVHHKLHELADPEYSHKFFVDGQIAVADAKIGGSWGTYLVGTLGAGGRGVFALDVTDPESFSQDDVLWEFQDFDLGYTFGEPIITRIGDEDSGKWVAVFGNGYNSGSEQARLFVVDLENGPGENGEGVMEIELGDYGDNGLSGVVGWRDPATRTHLSRVYAGDLKGNMWRIDFDGTTASVPYEDGLFTDPDGRAITSTPNVAAHPSGGLMVYFGTGKLIEDSDRLETEMDRFYAVRDLGEPVSNNFNGNGALAEVEIAVAETEDGEPPMRTLESGGVSQNGWYMDLAVSDSSNGERTLAKPRVVFGTVIISTYQPVEDPCTPGGIQRTYAMDALSGNGALPYCSNCGAIEVGAGAPFSPPVAIKQRQPGEVGDVTFPGNSDPSDPSDPDDFPGAPPADGGEPQGWCSEFGIPPLFEGGSFLPLGTICEGRQVWRQVK